MSRVDRAGVSRLATARQRVGAVALPVVVLAPVGAARSGRHDRTVDHLAQRMEAGYDHAASHVRRHLGR